MPLFRPRGWRRVQPVRTSLHPPSVASEPMSSPGPQAPARVAWRQGRLPCRSMSPTVNAALSLMALALAVAAIVLATIANRRWAQRPRA